MKFERNGRLYCQHPTLGLLLLGSWGWQRIVPVQRAGE